MNKLTVLFAILIICWTLNPFLRKKAIGNLSDNESLLLNQCFITILFFSYFAYLFISNNCSFTNLKNIQRKDLLNNLVSSFVTFISAVILMKLLNSNKVTNLVPQIQPLVIILTMFCGYFLFNETITLQQIIGTILIVLGILFFNKK